MKPEGAEQPALARSRVTRRRWISVTVAVGLLFGGIWLVRSILHGVHEVFMAEARLHAMYFVLVQVREYIDDHKEWPRSWSDLPNKLREPVGGPDVWSPTGFGPLPELVTIDFNAKLEEIAGQTPDVFTGVKFTQGAHYIHSYPIKEVIEAARRAVGR